MKQSLYISILLFLFYTATSCNQEKIDALKTGDGIVRDNSTEEPLAGALVYIYKEYGGSFSGGSGTSSLLEIDTTSSDGQFSFPYVDSAGINYFISVYHENYFESTNLDFYDPGEGYDIDVGLTPNAWLSIHFTNVLPSEPSDNFDINGGITDRFNGSEVDTIVTYLVFGNQNIELHWALYGSSGYHDTLYCIRFDTTYYEILY